MLFSAHSWKFSFFLYSHRERGLCSGYVENLSHMSLWVRLPLWCSDFKETKYISFAHWWRFNIFSNLYDSKVVHLDSNLQGVYFEYISFGVASDFIYWASDFHRNIAKHDESEHLSTANRYFYVRHIMLLHTRPIYIIYWPFTWKHIMFPCWWPNSTWSPTKLYCL